MVGKTVTQISVGDSASFSKTISESDVYSFAGVTGDMNPVHINVEYAGGTVFGKRIAHGILAIGFISNVLGTQLPGPGSIYVEQNCKFLKPVFIGDTITAIVTVIEKDEDKNRVRLRTYCVNQRKEITLDGEALMMPQKEKKN
ncbi:MAG: MaoC family dehydratase [Firmicutes bacterium]|nr:MaoC family dehydratase [Bacillota bacterium]